eukprot:gene3825-4764_t
MSTSISTISTSTTTTIPNNSTSTVNISPSSVRISISKCTIYTKSIFDEFYSIILYNFLLQKQQQQQQQPNSPPPSPLISPSISSTLKEIQDLLFRKVLTFCSADTGQLNIGMIGNYVNLGIDPVHLYISCIYMISYLLSPFVSPTPSICPSPCNSSLTSPCPSPSLSLSPPQTNTSSKSLIELVPFNNNNNNIINDTKYFDQIPAEQENTFNDGLSYQVQYLIICKFIEAYMKRKDSAGSVVLNNDTSLETIVSVRRGETVIEPTKKTDIPCLEVVTFCIETLNFQNIQDKQKSIDDVESSLQKREYCKSITFDDGIPFQSYYSLFKCLYSLSLEEEQFLQKIGRTQLTVFEEQQIVLMVNLFNNLEGFCIDYDGHVDSTLVQVVVQILILLVNTGIQLHRNIGDSKIANYLLNETANASSSFNISGEPLYEIIQRFYHLSTQIMFDPIMRKKIKDQDGDIEFSDDDDIIEEDGEDNQDQNNEPPPIQQPRVQRKRKSNSLRNRIRSRNPFIDYCLVSEDFGNSIDTYADLEDFIVVKKGKKYSK